MAYNKDFIRKDENVNYLDNNNNIYYGKVISIDDPYDGGIIKVRIDSLDINVKNDNLPDCYPILPKFLHIYPKVGEYVRILIENVKYPNEKRFWIGSIISQPHKIFYDTIYALTTSGNDSPLAPEKAPSTYPNAKGVYPEKDEIGLIGRKNTDVILRDNQIEIRVGKHENDEPLVRNRKNPGSISLTFEPIVDKENEYYSNNIIIADKIAFLSHDGIPKYKPININIDERNRIFDTGHPIARGDVLVEALNILRNAIINHIHGYAKLSADKDSIIKDLENINFDSILQKNIVIN